MNMLLRTLLTLAVILLAAGEARAAVPGRITFTARLVNGETAHEGPVRLDLRLFRAASGGNSVWTETHTATAAIGLVSLAIGEQTPLDAAVIDGGPLYLEVVVEGTALSPRLAIGSVPYALMAGRAESASRLGNLAETDVQRRVSMVCPAGSSIRAIDATGTPTCEADDGVTSASGTNGITTTVTGTNVAISTDATVQRRTSTNMTCGPGTYMRTIAQTGAVTCMPALTCQRIAGAAGATGTQTVSCPSGSIVMGGGCSSSSNTQILDSYPQTAGTSWFCRTTTGSAIQAIALCCDVSF